MSAKLIRSAAQMYLGMEHDELSGDVLHDAPLGDVEHGEEPGALVCRGIFSTNYLHQHFAKEEGFPTLEDVRPIYECLKAQWMRDYIGLTKRPEAYTRTQ